MGFYGNISGSNKSAFSFDKVYSNRYAMDQAIASGNTDGVFLGRYVLVEYDETPVSIWIKPSNRIAYTDNEYKNTLSPIRGIVYRDENSADEYGVPTKYYTWDSTAGTAGALVEITAGANSVYSPYAVNYNIDLQHYGRGYDGTVWRKVFDSNLNSGRGAYRYVLMAELNAAVPHFYYIVDAPAMDGSAAPNIDTQDSTNLNYYIHQKGFIENRFAPDEHGDTTITQYHNRWTYSRDTSQIQYRETHSLDTFTDEQVAINFNKAGFNPAAHQSTLDLIIDSETGAINDSNINGNNSVGYTAASSHRHYGLSLGTPQGAEVQNDLRLWYVNMPVFGNIAHRVYDFIYGYTGNNRKVTNYFKQYITDSGKMYDMNTIVGSLNRVRDALGYNVVGQAAALNTSIQMSPTDRDVHNIYTVDKLVFLGDNVFNSGVIDSIWYYKKVPHYIKYADSTPEDQVQYENEYIYYRKSDGYGLANPVVIDLGNRYRVDRYEYYPYCLQSTRTGDRYNTCSSMYGLIVAINRMLGTGVDWGLMRDPDTIPGMIGRMNDILGNINLALTPQRLIATTPTIDGVDPGGIIHTTDTMFPYDSTVSPASAASYTEPNNGLDIGHHFLLDGKGTWRLPVTYKLSGLNLTAANLTNIRYAVAYTDTINGGIDKLEHEFNALYGNRTYSVLAALTKHNRTPDVTNSNIVGIDTIDKIAQILNNRTETIDERINDLYMWRYMRVSQNEWTATPDDVDLLDTIAQSDTDGAWIADSENNADSFSFAVANKWLQIYLDTTLDKLTIAHTIVGDDFGTEVQTVTTGWGAVVDAGNHITDQDNSIVIPKFTFDNAGHVIAHGTTTHYLPNSFKYFKVQGNLANITDVVTDITPNNNQNVATKAADTYTFKAGNKWIRMGNDSNLNTTTIAHKVVPDYNGAVQTVTPSAGAAWSQDQVAANQITLPTFTIDQAGHVTSHGTTSFYLPHSYKYVAILAQSTAVTNSTGNTRDVEADVYSDTLTFGTDNKWLTIRGNGANDGDQIDDTIYLGHITSGVAAGSYGLASNQKVNPSAADVSAGWEDLDSDNTFQVPYFTVDEAGHITAASTKDVLIPEGYVQFKAQNHENVTTAVERINGSMSATSMVDTFMFDGGNKWITLAINNVNSTQKTLIIGHMLNGIGAKTDIGKNTGNQLTPSFNGTFIVPYISIDEAGHVTGLTTTQVTIPQGSIADKSTAAKANDGSSVMTGLGLTATSGALEREFTAVGTLTLTGYTTYTAEANTAVAATDSINAAIKKIEAHMAYNKTVANTELTTLVGALVFDSGTTNANKTVATSINQAEARAKAYTDTKIGTFPTGLTTVMGVIDVANLDVASGANKTVKNAIAKAVSDLQSYADDSETDAKSYTDAELAKLNTNYSTSTYMAATRNAIQGVSDKVGTLPTGTHYKTNLVDVIDINNLVVATNQDVTVVNAIAKAKSDINAVIGTVANGTTVMGQIGTVPSGKSVMGIIGTGYGDRTIMGIIGSVDTNKTVVSLISDVNDRIGTLPTGQTSVAGTLQNLYYTAAAIDNTLSGYVQSSVLNGYVQNSTLNDYLANADVENSVNAILANYDLALKPPVIEAGAFEIQAGGMSVTITELAGSTYTYNFVEVISDEVNNTIQASDSNTYTGTMSSGNYKVIITRRYNGMSASASSETLSFTAGE